MIVEPENLELTNAVITSAEISNDVHRLLTAWIYLKYGEGSQVFGGDVLYLPKSFIHHGLESPAGHFIWRVMEIAEVSRWSELEGKTIRVKHNSNIVWEIGHIIKDDWFCPSRDCETLTLKGDTNEQI